MIYLYHGEDFSASRNSFNQEKDKDSVLIDATDFDKNILNQLMSETSLFSEHKKVFIDSMFSKKSQKNFLDLVTFVNNATHLDIHIWADKEITKAQMKDIEKLEDKNFKIPVSIFGFLDSVIPGNEKNVTNFHNTLSSSAPEFVFTMIVRQFRLMLGILSEAGLQIDEVKRIQPWQASKLRKQADLFGLEKIRNTFKKLKKIDKNQKTGASKLSLIQEIDILLLEI